MLRLVLDTNAVLDLFLFQDAACAPIAQALQQGNACLIADALCLEELRRVLAYPTLGLEVTAQAALFERYRAQCQCYCHKVEVKMAGIETALTDELMAALPRCRDPDDQKFLELAVSARADALITRDKALLRLARRFRKFQPAIVISRPQDFAAICLHLCYPDSLAQ